MTKREKVVAFAYTGWLFCDFSDVHKYIEEKAGRPILTHEVPSTRDELQQDIHEDFIAMCKGDMEEKLSADEYQRRAMRTCNIPHQSERDMLNHAVLGLASEAGEVAGIFQKEYQGHTIDPEHLKRELGDCLWMIAEACESRGWTLSEVMQANLDKLQERYPDGFDPNKSLHRKEGDV